MGAVDSLFDPKEPFKNSQQSYNRTETCHKPQNTIQRTNPAEMKFKIIPRLIPKIEELLNPKKASRSFEILSEYFKMSRGSRETRGPKIKQIPREETSENLRGCF